MKLEPDNNEGLGRTTQLVQARPDTWVLFDDGNDLFHAVPVLFVGLTDLGYIVHYMFDSEAGTVTAEGCANFVGFFDSEQAIRQSYVPRGNGVWAKI